MLINHNRACSIQETDKSLVILFLQCFSYVYIFIILTVASMLEKKLFLLIQ